jgi:hypothetical protein
MDLNTLIALFIAIPLATWFLKINARKKVRNLVGKIE